MLAVEHVASSPCGQGIPFPVLKPAVTQIFPNALLAEEGISGSGD